MTALEMSLKIAVKLEALAVVPVEPALDAINQAVHYLSLKLADRNSDLARGNYSRSTSKQTAALPDDFNGFCSKPSIDGVSLEPLPPWYTPENPGKPRHYNVVDQTLYLYPSPASAVTVIATYWVVQSELTATDDIPFRGRFDSLLLNMAAKIAVSGFSVMSQQAFMIEVEQGLDSVLFPRRPALPTNRPYHSF